MSDIWLLTYEVAPDPKNPDFRSVGGAYVNCWIRASSQADAAEIAGRQLSETQWSIVELTEAKPVNPEAEQYPPASMRMIEQAQIDGAVFLFNKWPMTARKRRWYLLKGSVVGTLIAGVLTPAGGPIAIAEFALSGCAIGLLVGLILDVRQHRAENRN